jgi:hypothetical protein
MCDVAGTRPPMLETYFVKPQAVDWIRACWIGAEMSTRSAGYLGRAIAPDGGAAPIPMLVAFGSSPAGAVPRRWRICPLTSSVLVTNLTSDGPGPVVPLAGKKLGTTSPG